MAEQDETLGLVEDYLGMNRRVVTIFVALIAGAAVVATAIFIGLYGFQHWRTHISRAGSQMVIGFDEPAATGVATQYVCPKCGPVGLPSWSKTGQPRCPRCGATMGAR